MNKTRTANNLYMAGGGISGLTSQTFRPISYGSDTIFPINSARPHKCDRYRALLNNI